VAETLKQMADRLERIQTSLRRTAATTAARNGSAVSLEATKDHAALSAAIDALRRGDNHE
jgi:hypothetical protein